LFGEGQLNFNYGKTEQEPGVGYKSTQKSYGVSLSLAPGIAYAVNRRFHLEAGLSNLVNIGYSKSKYKQVSPLSTTNSESSGFNFFTGVSSSSPFNIGFRIVLGK
jgi:hypothetical protein